MERITKSDGKEIVGIVPISEVSKRFPGKNLYFYEGSPMFLHSLDKLRNSNHISRVVIATSSEKVIDICSNNGYTNIVRRTLNADDRQDSVMNVIRFAYMNLSRRYDYVCTLFPNTVGYRTEDVDKACVLAKTTHLAEVRGYNKQTGIENGLLVFSHERIMREPLSTYVGAVFNNGKEVHYASELVK